MRRISEEAYCAGWLSGLEFYLWRFFSEGPGQFGGLDITNEHIASLQSLSDACGGWIVWDGAMKDEVFVPLIEWQQRFAAWTNRKRS